MELTELACKNCGAPLKADNVVEHLAMARCDHCGTVFALEQEQHDETPASEPRVLRPWVEMPKGIRVVDLGVSVELRRRWYSSKILFLLFFCVFWNGFMVVWHGIALASGTWIMSVFGLLHTGVGVFLAYTTAAGLLNTTSIRSGQGVLAVTHGPIPWRGKKEIVADQVRQLYCKENTQHTKNGTNCTYEVLVVKNTNVSESLVKGIDNAEQALFIEQELERRLHLEDEPVRGELPR